MSIMPVYRNPLFRGGVIPGGRVALLVEIAR